MLTRLFNTAPIAVNPDSSISQSFLLEMEEFVETGERGSEKSAQQVIYSNLLQ